ncbi:unnamed protein product [Miscanthus lutarioriparius]|uniref:Uncharacterized protein n=1 Tax=Miscanthus lutarioriparius TaxID=422564 RepID=A0A811NFH0_9POAL|nr:unnamed protein product [Miscanthus lutarioriparius]
MASVGFGTVAPTVASPAAWTTSPAGRRARHSTAHVPAATKVVTAASAAKQQEEKGLFDTIFGALYKEEQLLETDPILNKVAGKAAAPAPKKASAAAPEESGGNGGFSLGGFFSSKPKTKKG